MFYENASISYLTKLFQISISEVDLAHRKVLFDPERLPTFKKSEISKETIDLSGALFKQSRSGNTGRTMYVYANKATARRDKKMILRFSWLKI